MALCRAESDAMGTAMCLAQLGLARIHRKEVSAAEELLLEAASMSEVNGEQWRLSYIHWCIGLLHLEQGAGAGARFGAPHRQDPCRLIQWARR
ncbi:hypothetical protein ACFV0R_14725 [Streptomyces sp. NPDC059578]|uniref:hypothetical protein n=1 Tax=unclassified Streptomyces TaxID=2593676 RepID=UPI00365449E4